MRPKTNKLLMFLVGVAITGCSSQTERSSSGGGDQYQPEKESVQFVERPLEEAPPPKPAPVAAAPTSEPAAEFPVTKYEMPDDPVQEDEAVEDLGPLPDESVSAQQEELAADDSSIGETAQYDDEQIEEEELEELGPLDDESVSAEQDAAPAMQNSIADTTEYPDEEPADEEIGELGPMPDESGTLSYPEERRAAADSVVGEPKMFADEPVAAAAPEAAPAPKPAPAPQTAPAAPRSISVDFEADPLFGFDKSAIRADQRLLLDELVASIDGAEVLSISVIGHADRIGSRAYNQKLSKRRAESVRAYLASKGVSADRIQMEARGEDAPVTGDTCAKERGRKLIACFQPDRRVEVSVSGSKLTN